MPTINNYNEQDVLSNFALELLQEAVFWVNSAGNIVKVNSKACEMTGYAKEELTKLHVLDLNPSEVVADFPGFWRKLKQEKKITFQAQHKHKTGYLYDVEIS